MITSDQEIVEALLNRNPRVTRDFFYRKCYPLFKSIYDNYHTDCSSVMEFVNEIYVHILTPDKQTGMCRLQKFSYQSTLFTWLKTVCLFYCYKRFERNSRVQTTTIVEKFDDEGVRIDILPESIDIDSSAIDHSDAETILRLMPNKRYSQLIRYRYLEGKSNEETAQLLGMNMNTFYNKHKLAKEQYIIILRKEG